MKIFISMPMKAKSVEQVRIEMNKVFNQILQTLPDANLIDSIIDGADKNIAIQGDSAGIWYLGESLKKMSEADLVFFVNDWDNYRGCATERRVAEAYGKFCLDIKVNLN